jgi:short-subunit dehydrogenase
MAVQRYRAALVTGASSGVGTAFARRLAADGCSLVLVARRAKQLGDLADQIRAADGVQVEVLGADLTAPEELQRVEQRLADPDQPIDLLVNNAGVFGSIGYLADQAADAEAHKIELNTVAMVRLARAVLPGMLERRRGGIVNVSSVAAFVPTPRAATYSATKAFITSFSESLHGETRGRGVAVTALCPGPMQTTIHDADPGRPKARTPARLGTLDPAAVAAAGLEAIGAGRPVCVPGRRWAVIAAASRTLPRPVVRQAFYRLWGSMQQPPKGREECATPPRS